MSNREKPVRATAPPALTRNDESDILGAYQRAVEEERQRLVQMGYPHAQVERKLTAFRDKYRRLNRGVGEALVAAGIIRPLA